MDRTYRAEPNPDHGQKGERRFCVFRYDDGENGSKVKLPRQFNAMRPALRFAYQLECTYWSQRNRIPYLGD
jgi:hypothetical protein